MTAGDPRTIDVALASDDRYAMPLAVAVRSLVENLATGTKIRLFILDGGLTEQSRERLRASWSGYDVDVQWVKPDLSRLAGVAVSGHIPLASYFRLLAADLLPESVGRLLYLDSDVVVLRDVTELSATDLRGHPIGAVQDQNAWLVSRPNGLVTWRELGLPESQKYFNAGVLLLDLARWRRERIGSQVLAYVTENRARIRWHDQDGLNAVLGRQVLELDPRWNVSIQFDAASDDTPPRETDAAALVRDAFIMHFSSRVKPWHTDSLHPSKALFFDYLARTAWAGFRPTLPSTGLPAPRWRTIARHLRDRGLAWTALHLGRESGERFARFAERRMIAIEQRRFLVGPETAAARSHTRQQNRRWWDRYDWSRGGEEWTADAAELRGVDPAAWKQALVEDVLLRYVRPGSDVVEIGPGAGRWTEHLQPIARRLVLVDISARCLELCRRRFADAASVEYHQVDAPSLAFLADRSIDAVWSYDAFVHIHATDTDRYLAEIARVLRPGGIAVVHHAGTYVADAAARRALRSYMNAAFFAALGARRGLELVEQDDRHPHMPGDVISILRRPATR